MLVGYYTKFKLLIIIIYITQNAINSFKIAVFNLYGKYEKQMPTRGKWRFINFLDKVRGLATYRIDNILLELNPIFILDRKLIDGKVHDETVKNIITNCLAQGGTFIDIGANIGYFSLLAASIANVKVLAFEPSPRELARFYRNISLNKLSNITVFPFGISKEPGTLALNLASHINPGMNSVLDLSDSMAYLGSVPCYFTTLESLVSPLALSDVHLCKIDVEGFEMSVLHGLATSIDLMNNAVFVVEICSENLAKAGCKASDIYDFFDKYGYIPKLGILDLHIYDEIFIKKSF